jgi:hypothetical protein
MQEERGGCGWAQIPEAPRPLRRRAPLERCERLAEAFACEVLYLTSPADGAGVRTIQTRAVEGSDHELSASIVQDEALEGQSTSHS